MMCGSEERLSQLVCVFLLCAARNKDNSWPEEIMAVLKEVRAKDKEGKDKQDDDKSSGNQTSVASLD